MFKKMAPSRDPWGLAALLTHGGLQPLKNIEETLNPHKSKATGLRNELYEGKRNAC